jgi:ResB-like family
MTDRATIKTSLNHILAICASPRILFYGLPWLMLLLTLGTIAQKEMGLYAAQKMFFSSWILWIGVVPFPGAYLTLGVISVCLLIKFIGYSPWQKSKAGIILSHLGVLLLMIGGLFTAITQKESFVMLGEGQEIFSASDYHARVLTIEKDGTFHASLPFEQIVPNKNIISTLPFTIHVLEACDNCQPSMIKDPDGRMGFAQKVELLKKPPEKENEANMSGLTFSVSGTDKKQDGVYIAVEEIPLYPIITKDGSEYRFKMERQQTQLPFSMILNEFKRELHPGTNMASGFSSSITIKDGKIEWPYTISMNNPLRYKGYTFYQSSFSIRPDGTFSILSIVENKGRVFPYIASVVLFFGLLTHLIIKSRAKAGKTT